MKTGFRPRRPRRLLFTAAIVIAALTVLGVVHAVPRSEARPRTPAPAATLRLVTYETAPAKAVAGRPAEVGAGGAGAAVRSQLAALAWAGADAALVHWGGPSTVGDRKLAALLAGIRVARVDVQAAVLITGRSSAVGPQLRALAKLRARSPGYLHIRSRPVVFVAPGEQARRSCAQARRVRAAARGLWLGQAALPATRAAVRPPMRGSGTRRSRGRRAPAGRS